MTHAYYYDVPSTPEMHRAVTAEMGDVQPSGLITHLVVRHDGGLRHYGVWVTRQDWERFRDEVVRPAVARVFARSGMAEPPLPQEHHLDVIAVQTMPIPAASVAAR